MSSQRTRLLLGTRRAGEVQLGKIYLTFCRLRQYSSMCTLLVSVPCMQHIAPDSI